MLHIMLGGDSGVGEWKITGQPEFTSESHRKMVNELQCIMNVVTGHTFIMVRSVSIAFHYLF